MKRLSFVLIPILVIVVAGSLIYLFFPADITHQNNLRFEFVKFLIQLLIIVILGGILIQEYNRSRERIKNLNEFRKTLLTNLIQAYFKVKKARRILAANTISANSNKEEIPCSVYEAQIIEIIDAQLEFENHYYQLNTFRYTFSSESIKKLIPKAERMEKYLNELIKEYRELKVPFSSSSPAIDTSKLPKLKDFFINSNNFGAKFSNYFHESFELIQSEILKI